MVRPSTSPPSHEGEGGLHSNEINFDTSETQYSSNDVSFLYLAVLLVVVDALADRINV